VKIRNTVRALLFDRQGRLLLIQYKDDPNITGKGKPEMTHYWGTVGGGMDPGEDFETALRREILEETGFTDIKVGPFVWHRKCDLNFYGEPVHIDERYYVAHAGDTADFDLSRHTEIEKKFVMDMRWWPVGDIEKTADVVYPLGMQRHIRDIAEGRYPQTPVLWDI
jgi:8-oxo-dGTP pyrophosphatase MutT (NUDIX family)